MRLLILIPLVVICLTCFGQNLAEDFDSVSARKAAEEVATDTLADELFEVYADAMGNWSELADFVAGYEGEKRDDAIWLVQTMPHLDRLLASSDILREHLDYSLKAKEQAPWPIPDDMFRPYILSYRISYEPVTPWRKLFWDEFAQKAFAAGSVEDAALTINKWVAENIDTASYSFFGGMRAPDQTYRGRRGTSREISALTTAILMSLGIPGRNASIRTVRGDGNSMSWVEIFDADSEKWIPLYPDEPGEFGDYDYPINKYPGGMTTVNVSGGFEYDLITSSYAPTGFLAADFTRGNKPAIEWEHFSITVFSGGAYWPLDEIGAEADSNGRFEIELAAGEYVLQNGMRDQSGSVWVQTLPFTITESETTALEVAVDAPEYIGAEPESGIFPEFTLSDTKGNPFSHKAITGKKPIVLFFFDPDGEPSVRAFPEMENLTESFSDSVRFIYVYVKTGDSEPPETDRRILIDENGLLASIITGAETIAGLSDEFLPLVLFNTGKSISYETVSEGYNTNLKNVLTQRIEKCLEKRQQ